MGFTIQGIFSGGYCPGEYYPGILSYGYMTMGYCPDTMGGRGYEAEGGKEERS